MTPATGPFVNVLNSFKDDAEDGFYSRQIRDSYFPAIVYLDDGKNTHDVYMTGSVPEQMRFVLNAKTKSQTDGIIVKVHYARSTTVNVFKGGSKVDPEGFAAGGGGAILKADMKPVTGLEKGCGENNFSGGGDNILTFWLTA
jgi:hypothetical protein